MLYGPLLASTQECNIALTSLSYIVIEKYVLTLLFVLKSVYMS